MPKYLFIFLSLFSFERGFSQKITIQGTVYDKDSITTVSFAYVVNKNSSLGVLTDEKGFFSIPVTRGDTLSFSCLGYGLTKIQTHLLTDSAKNGIIRIKVYLMPKSSELNPVIITAHEFSKERKESYARKINEYERALDAGFVSPITAMYYWWSKKGKELKKLSVLYDQLMIEEIKEYRLSPEKIRTITGNDTIDVKDFMSHCFLPDQFITTSSDYELFFAVKQCYKQYMELKKKP